MTTTHTNVCVLCSQNCGLELDVQDNRIVKVRADPTNPLTEGYTCNKAYRVAHYAQHRQRLEEPLKRGADGEYTPISWDQAISEIGGKLRATLDTHGPESVAFLGIGGQGNHMSVLYGLAVLVGIDTPWWFNALGQEKTQRTLVDSWMLASPPDAMLVGHLDDSDYAIIVGSNPRVSQRGSQPGKMLREFEKDPARTLVVVDPRLSETARRADLHLPIKVGTDAFFLLALAAIIVEEELYAADFVRDRTRGFEDIAAVLADLDVDTLLRRCGLDPEQVRTVARGYAAAERGGLDMDLGLEQSRFNTLTAYLYRLVLALTGNLCKPGGGVFVSVFVPRMKGVRPPSHTAPVSGLPSIPLFAPVSIFSPALFAEEVLRDDPGRIRVAIVEGSNPVLSYAETPRVLEAFGALDLSVSIEVAETETTRVSDYVLPAPVGYEKWEVANFPKAYPLLGTQVRPPALVPPEGTLAEPEIYHRLALAAGVVVPAPGVLNGLARRARQPVGALVYLAALFTLAFLWTWRLHRVLPMVLFWAYETLGPLLEDRSLAAIWLNCQGVAWTRRAEVARRLPETAGRWNRSAVGNQLFDEVMAHPEGVILGETDPETELDDHIGHSDGRVRLAPEPMLGEIARALAETESVDPEFPFVLNGGMRTHWTANTNFRDPAWRKGRGPHCALRMNDGDAERLGITKGDRVRVRSRTGAVTLPALPESHVQAGHIHIPNGFGTRYPDPDTGELVSAGVSINELTDAQDRDPFTGCPHFKYLRCDVQRVEA
jgi:anaerobic selenocysteine-containing dehydrogenase